MYSGADYAGGGKVIIIHIFVFKTMDKFPCLLTVALLASQFAVAQPDSVFRARQIINIEQNLMDALPGDTSIWAKYLDEDWYIINENGTGYHKKEFLKTFGPFPKGFSGRINVTYPVLTFHDKFAIIHYVADEYEEIFGQQLHTSYATADTYYQTADSWKMIGSQVFEIPRLPAATTLKPSILKSYTGNYRLSDSTVARVFIEHDTLFIEKKGKREALLPETLNVFFRKTDARGRKIFVTNDEGQKLMLERRNGIDLVWKKVN